MCVCVFFPCFQQESLSNWPMTQAIHFLLQNPSLEQIRFTVDSFKVQSGQFASFFSLLTQTVIGSFLVPIFHIHTTCSLLPKKLLSFSPPPLLLSWPRPPSTFTWTEQLPPNCTLYSYSCLCDSPNTPMVFKLTSQCQCHSSIPLMHILPLILNI